MYLQKFKQKTLNFFLHLVSHLVITVFLPKKFLQNSQKYYGLGIRDPELTYPGSGSRGQSLHFGPMRWVPGRFFKILIFIGEICILIRDF
jgi:hypothetical protein